MSVAVSGNPTPEELAAVVALLAGRSSEAEESAVPAPSRWNARGPLLRQPLQRGPGSWRSQR